MSLSKLYFGSDAFGIHQQTSGTILAEYLTALRDRIGRVKSVGFLAQTRLLSVVHKLSIGLRSTCTHDDCMHHSFSQHKSAQPLLCTPFSKSLRKLKLIEQQKKGLKHHRRQLKCIMTELLVGFRKG